jgi:hypothetical protein
MKPSVLAGFPEPLAAIAFVNGEEPAWEQKDCRAAIDWLSRITRRFWESTFGWSETAASALQ